MTEFLRLILDTIQYIWPFEIVWEWERGGYYICGRYVWPVGPGLYPKIPYLCDIKTVDVVPDVYSTGLNDVTTKSGDILTFDAAVTFIVTDAAKALNRVVRHEETTVELAGAVLADLLADIEEDRFDPAKRRGLIKLCLIRINSELEDFGTEVTAVRFTTFVRKQRTYRLLTHAQPGV